MNLSIRKGNYPSFSPDIHLIALGGGQYQITTQLTNSAGTDIVSQVVLYWAAAGTPGAQNQLNGWSLPAYIQPYFGYSNPTAPLDNPGGSGPPLGPVNTLVWAPDANVINAIAASFDPNHIMIIAQIIADTPTYTTHPLDFNWWPGTNTWVAAAVFNWPSP
jgi:hypothetical protein